MRAWLTYPQSNPHTSSPVQATTVLSTIYWLWQMWSSPPCKYARLPAVTLVASLHSLVEVTAKWLNVIAASGLALRLEELVFHWWIAQLELGCHFILIITITVHYDHHCIFNLGKPITITVHYKCLYSFCGWKYRWRQTFQVRWN